MVSKLVIGFDAIKTEKLKDEKNGIFTTFGLSKVVKIPELEEASPGGPVLHYIQVDNGEVREVYELYTKELSITLPATLQEGPHIITYTNNDFYEWKVFLIINGRKVARVHDNIGSVKFRITKNIILPVPQYWKSLTSKDVSRARLVGATLQR